ncbi:MAG: hypothetical protein J5917_07940 [Bacteroidales bacterium]|nr:hypothetical protein [Bacteroidales bacterium]
MKRLISTTLLLLAALSGLAGERIYIVTDRNAYIAGDMVYCSLFVVDDSGAQSNFSAVSYLELISAEGTAVEAKIGLFAGRGAGAFRLPSGMPSGNYRLVAYTSGNAYSPDGARTLAVFNTSSLARVKGGVRLNSGWKPAPLPAEEAKGGIRVSMPGRRRTGQSATLMIHGTSAQASVAVSVAREDGLAPADGQSLETFLQGAPAPRTDRPGEYEGEIIEAAVMGLKNASGQQVTAILSTAGSPSSVYLGRDAGKGHIRFYTSNIYGDRELVCEVLSQMDDTAYISLASPFTHPSPGDIAPLELGSEQRSLLISRKSALACELQLDTLLEFLPKREDLLLDESTRRRYHLDDYTRFPTVREICVEFIPELSFVKRDGRWRIRMMSSDGAEQRHYMQENVLVMMDGVVLSDHGMLESFDAMLLEDIDLYMQSVVIGGVSYNGVVNFISKNNYVTALPFPPSVRVVDFKGVSYPLAYPGGVPSDGADRRHLLFWHPALDVPSDGMLRIPLTMPSYPGVFRVQVEGWTADGQPVSACYRFEVE